MKTLPPDFSSIGTRDTVPDVEPPAYNGLFYGRDWTRETAGGAAAHERHGNSGQVRHSCVAGMNSA